VPGGLSGAKPIPLGSFRGDTTQLAMPAKRSSDSAAEVSVPRSRGSCFCLVHAPWGIVVAGGSNEGIKGLEALAGFEEIAGPWQ